MDPHEFQPWYPEGVRQVIAAGASNYIGVVDEKTVLKFPLVSPNEGGSYTTEGQKFRRIIRETAVSGLNVEEQILRILGQHPRIIRLVQKTEYGLLLEYMPNGSVERYLRNAPSTSPNQRLIWAWQAAEGLAYIHGKNVLHCDISAGNLLLDDDLTLKLCDFQGRLLDSDGRILLDGGAAEGTMSTMPRLDRNYSDYKTDIFALGTAIYFIMTGQQPFPDLDTIDDEDEILRRFEGGKLPPLDQHQGGDVMRSRWMGRYEQASEVVSSLHILKSL